MQAFHNDPTIKQKYLNRVRAHRKADNLIRGQGWDGHRGCAVGCTLEIYDHTRYPVELGIPEWLARVEDVIFEGLTLTEAMEWPENFLEAIPVGVDLEQIKAPFMIFVLESTLKNFDHNQFPDVKNAISDVITSYRSGEISNEQKRSAAWSATWSAESATWSAESATRFAAESAAWFAAWSATWSATRFAAESAAWSAAWSAAEPAAYKKFADKLLELLKTL